MPFWVLQISLSAYEPSFDGWRVEDFENGVDLRDVHTSELTDNYPETITRGISSAPDLVLLKDCEGKSSVSLTQCAGGNFAAHSQNDQAMTGYPGQQGHCSLALMTLHYAGKIRSCCRARAAKLPRCLRQSSHGPGSSSPIGQTAQTPMDRAYLDP